MRFGYTEDGSATADAAVFGEHLMTEKPTYTLLYTLLQAEPRIQNFPAGPGGVCPVCGSTTVEGTVYELTGLAELDPDPVDGVYYFNGETDVDQDSQRTITSVNGDPLVQCGAYHWYFAVGWTNDGESVGPEQVEEEMTES